MHSIGRLLLATVLALGASTGIAAAAADSVIHFDEIGANQTVSSQYVASEGVEFGSPNTFGVATDSTDRCGPDHAPGSGLLSTIADGITGPSLLIQCVGKGNADTNTDLGYIAGWRFTTERRKVDFDLRASDAVDFTEEPGPKTVTIRVLGVTGNELYRRTDTLPLNGTEHVRYPTDGSLGDQTIAYVFISSLAGSARIDNLVAPNDDHPPAAKYSIALTQPSLDLPEGSSGTVQIRPIRFNGSTGTIPLQVSALPTGITAAVPDPLSGTVAANLKITAASPVSGDRQITVTSASGSAGSFVGTPVTVSVHFESTLYGDRQTTGVAIGCGGRDDAISVGVRGTYSGRVTASYTKISGPATLTPGATTVTASGVGELLFPFHVESPVTETPTTYNVSITPEGATPITVPLAVYAGAAEQLRITGADATTIVRPPGSGTRHEQVILRGNFASACATTFIDDRGTTLPVIPGGVPRAPGQDSGIRIDLGTDPVTTSIRAMAAGGTVVATSPLIRVYDFRNTYGPKEANFGSGASYPGFDWDAFQAAFGADDTDACIDAVCVHDPWASHYYDKWVGFLTSGDGLCFGWAAQAASFYEHLEDPSAFETGVQTGYTFSSWANSTRIKRNIAVWFIRQMSSEVREQRNAQKTTPNTPEGLRQKIVDAVEHGRTPLIDLWFDTEPKPGVVVLAGHTVVAYDVRPTPAPAADGSYDILTYNPNIPFDPFEVSTASTRAANLEASTIHVTPDGTWSGLGGRSGPMRRIAVLDQPPSNPTLPIGVPSITAATATTATIAQISIGGKDALDAHGEVIDGHGVEDETMSAGPEPDTWYGLTGPKAATVTVVGRRKATYEQFLLGGTTNVSIEGASTAPGQHDTYTVTPNQPRVSFASDAASTTVTVKLDQRVGGTMRAATGAARARVAAARPTHGVSVRLTAGGDRSDTISVNGRAVTLDHGGSATSAAITLTGTGEGPPSSVTLAPISLGSGQDITVRPDSWADLNAGASYQVRAPSGRVVRSGRAAMRAPKTIAMRKALRIAVRRQANGAGQVTVSGRITKRGRAPQLIVVVRIVRDGRAVATYTASRRGAANVRNGRFAVPVAIATLPHGVRATVTATLVDEAADLASIRATGSVRVR